MCAGVSSRAHECRMCAQRIVHGCIHCVHYVSKHVCLMWPCMGVSACVCSMYLCGCVCRIYVAGL